MTSRSSTRGRALATFLVALVAPGCFVLFSLDGYGPSSDTDADGATTSDARSDAADAGDAAKAKLPGRTVFVTSTTFTGDLGARDGGDTRCQALAIDAGLGGSFRVWLSDVGSDGIAFLALDAGPLRLPDGTFVADDVQQLADGGPRSPIVQDERGRRLAVGGCFDGGPEVWTATSADGHRSGGQDCNRWTNGTAGLPGRTGLVGGPGATWTDACKSQCNVPAALYCIQQ